mmetsp:Transcript_32479/g.104914  ORF Transcript_32479/g.104914 Transcript_32479/m.104914 type:complete len:212 (-) Transcript_32479:149-784(-)
MDPPTVTCVHGGAQPGHCRRRRGAAHGRTLASFPRPPPSAALAHLRPAQRRDRLTQRPLPRRDDTGGKDATIDDTWGDSTTVDDTAGGDASTGDTGGEDASVDRHRRRRPGFIPPATHSTHPHPPLMTAERTAARLPTHTQQRSAAAAQHWRRRACGLHHGLRLPRQRPPCGIAAPGPQCDVRHPIDRYHECERQLEPGDCAALRIGGRGA